MKRKKRYADGGLAEHMMIVEGKRRSMGFDPTSLGRAAAPMGPSLPDAGGMGGRGGGMRPGITPRAVAPRPRLPIASTSGFTGPTFRGDQGQVSAGLGPRGSIGVGGRMAFKKGGAVKASSASKRADGCATKGKTKGRFV